MLDPSFMAHHSNATSAVLNLWFREIAVWTDALNDLSLIMTLLGSVFVNNLQQEGVTYILIQHWRH